MTFIHKKNSDYQVAKKRLEPTSIWCQECNIPATEIREHCECHTCEDWNGCSDPYPVVAAKCEKCGTTESFK